MHLILLQGPAPLQCPASNCSRFHQALLSDVAAVECSARRRVAPAALRCHRVTALHRCPSGRPSSTAARQASEVLPAARRPTVRPAMCSRHGVRPSPARACPGVRRSCPVRRCCPQLGSCPRFRCSWPRIGDCPRGTFMPWRPRHHGVRRGRRPFLPWLVSQDSHLDFARN